ncbi:predicted protein [Nematostella vectensis]|uniref:Protein LEG1 homolog n=1 Tax=Nematostella vectensis TaxID=45351 RepID=A7RX68_NEMVE|nr:predicted protein [Nematostella vectensis]|eukprot:XP_001636041.1 predicted protein [Nematostella vectensis]
MTLVTAKPQPSFSSSPYPPEWTKAPSSLSDFPVREIQGRNVTVIDAWTYLGRLGAYRVLVEATREYFSDWGFNNTGNLLWGLPLQFGWQKTTGRLRKPLTMGNATSNFHESEKVSPYSWWADMNYFLSILPLLGAVNAGTLNPLGFPVYVLGPNSVTSEFCSGVKQCSEKYPEVIDRWTEFFKHLRDKKHDPAKDITLGYLWKAHTTSIHSALPLFTDVLALLPQPEINFGTGWAQLVKFIAACHFQTNLNNTHAQQILGLPPRMLHSRDHPPFIRDFTTKQNTCLAVINLILDVQKLSNGGALKLWEKAMCSAQGRKDGRNLLENLLVNPLKSAEEFLKVVVDFMRDHDC